MESENLNQSKVDPPPVTKRPLYVKSIERCYQAIKQHDGKDRFPARFRSYTCDVCSKSFLKFSNLIYHDQLKHKHLLETQGAQCDQCLEVFLNANRLDTHILMKHATRQHQCPHCMNSYVSWNSLRVHMYQHTGTLITISFDVNLANMKSQ
ncbi:protein krueppel-like [Diaphorina citri]|uniref:Protein krueppel-like n=1 Tax=Diaphorina citri TaxID=121845 RepID=A0A3Q0JA01_DIACI|nr:protein krueppel-like [Diaphorina citri]